MIDYVPPDIFVTSNNDFLKQKPFLQILVTRICVKIIKSIVNSLGIPKILVSSLDDATYDGKIQKFEQSISIFWVFSILELPRLKYTKKNTLC